MSPNVPAKGFYHHHTHEEKKGAHHNAVEVMGTAYDLELDEMRVVYRHLSAPLQTEDFRLVTLEFFQKSFSLVRDGKAIKKLKKFVKKVRAA